MDAAILFEAEAFRLDGKKLMGRQVAGNGFIRACAGANSGGELWGFSPFSDASAVFRQTVNEIDPSVTTHWIARGDQARMAERRVLFRPDNVIMDMAALRLRAGAGAYSVCGITHTLSGPSIGQLASYSRAALMPWDALICTSRAAVSVVEEVFAAENDFLNWRLGQQVSFPRPQLPVIPLGVHTADFADRTAKRPAARSRLNLADDEVAVLFAGRLTFHAKAHPYQMYAALQAAAERTGKKIVLVQAGQAPNEQVYKVLRQGMASFCPDVRSIFIDGKDFDAYAAAWSAADIFMSISDNIQETFGITPIEAMASGIPVIVSDWDGYRDTVRDGEDGFRIPSYAPAPGSGDHIATAYETGDLNYDYMLFRTCVAVGVDLDILVDRVSRLVEDSALRERLGQAAQERARTVYDWAAVYKRYRSLWDDLDAIRLTERDTPRWADAPRNSPSNLDPFSTFGAFPTHHIGGETRIAARPGASAERHANIQASPLFEHWQVAPRVVKTIFDALPGEPTCAELAAKAQLSVPLMTEVIARMVKMGLVRPL
jgi:glycosyltransferase involved in cell wall biosynthesis